MYFLHYYLGYMRRCLTTAIDGAELANLHSATDLIDNGRLSTGLKYYIISSNPFGSTFLSCSHMTPHTAKFWRGLSMDSSLFLVKQAGLVERLLILSSADIPLFSGHNGVTATFGTGSISAPPALRISAILLRYFLDIKKKF